MDKAIETNQETQIFQQMLEIWNQTVQTKLNPGQESSFSRALLTEKRKKLLSHFVDAFLRGSGRQEQLGDWQEYCSLIAKSRYLAGHNPSGFKVTLDWGLIPDNALKVVEGGIYDKPEPVKTQPSIVSWEEFSEELSKTLPSSPYLAQWVKISISLAQMIGQLKYRNWFSKVSLKELTPTKVVFAVEGDFTKDYIVSHFSSEIRCAVQSHYPTVSQIEFEACPHVGGDVSQGGVA